MNQLKNINILLGISGGIAAYKSCELVRLLVKQGAKVRIILTENAKQFVTPISLQALSANPVRSELFDPQAEAAMSHIELAKWADILIIAPASADMIAKISHGFADNLLSTVWLASNAKKIIAPAMNKVMWLAPATIKNINTLKQENVTIIGPENGEQACGDVGLGRMSEVQDIVATIISFAPTTENNNLNLSSLKIMITAGPTVEEIDPVRYISNNSSGKMGYAIANIAIEAGAEVVLVTGPTHLEKPNCSVYEIKSAQQMLNKVFEQIDTIDIFIACAAVADYRVDQIAKQKIKKKKGSNSLELKLIKNPDIIKQVALLAKENKLEKPFTIAFAAETNDLEINSKRKLIDKGVDLIAANWVGYSASGDKLGFNQDDNELFLFWKNGNKHLKRSSKKIIAYHLLKQIKENYENKCKNQ